jgi:hypothetical protein
MESLIERCQRDQVEFIIERIRIAPENREQHPLFYTKLLRSPLEICSQVTITNNDEVDIRRRDRLALEKSAAASRKSSWFLTSHRRPTIPTSSESASSPNSARN